MDMKSVMSSRSSSSQDDDDSSSKYGVVNGMDDGHQGPLPGFRFHPTDQELVSFYLKRKIDKRALSIEIIKQMDIYKHDPWDLAKSSSVGDKEWYFYCKRGRKYRNSVRPNRVTGSGFWKATGIDKPIYSNGGEGQQCVGLKKSLVYYRGSAGKGTKTDWMMHEFRLPNDLLIGHPSSSNPANNSTAFEAEIWTLCRIFKRNKRQTPDWKEISARRNAVNSSSKSRTIETNPNHERYISFTTYPLTPNNGCINISTRPNHNNNNNNVVMVDQKNDYFEAECNQSQCNTMAHSTPVASDSSTLMIGEDYESDLGYFYGRNWDDLSSVVEFAVRTPLL